MNDTARIDRAIRISFAAGGLLLVLSALSIVLIASGFVSFGPRTGIWVALLSGTALLELWTARSMRQDRDDPSGIERRFEAAATTLGAAVIVVSVVGVVGLIAWGLLG